MDNTTTSIIALVGIALSIGSTVIGVVNHKRIRSNCCGKKLEASLDIDSSSPIKGTSVP
jgi:hypothetical protein